MKKPVRIYLSSLEQPATLARLDHFPHDPLKGRGLAELRRYTGAPRIVAGKKKDFDAALALARYTSEAWSHDGFNSKTQKVDALTVLKLARKGASFSCVQFGSVFMQLCQSVGIPARVIQARTRDAGLGSSGNGHVTAEYYDNQLQKWVWVDPQIHAYASARGTPLSLSEFAELTVQRKPTRIHFSSRTLAYLKGRRSGYKILTDFVRRYVWDLRVGGLRAFYTNQSKITPMGCKRDGFLPSITFQGFADSMVEYVSREQFDAPLNACRVRFETKEPKKNIELKTLADYKANAYKNFAVNDIKVHFEHSTPWFSHYEVIFNGRKNKTKKSTTGLKLRPGRNTLTVTPVNLLGRHGSPTKAVIHYDNRYKNVKSYW